MQTIVILWYPERLENPTANLRYDVPERIKTYTNGQIYEDGYDYLEENQFICKQKM